jgi:hypothetical protein
VHRLVVVGTFDSIAADVSPELTRQMRNFQPQIRKDGIRKVDGPGVLRHDCPEAVSVGAGKDCYAFEVSGVQTVPLAGTHPIKARLRIWVALADDRWEVINYDYSVLPG